MANFPTEPEHIIHALLELGFTCFGEFTIELSHCSAGSSSLAGKKALLIGNAGNRMWEVFSGSEFFGDGEANPMDRWTKHCVTMLCDDFGLEALFPFEKPFWPFQKFARAASGMQSSPLGLLIHPEFGLWQAYRAAVVLRDDQKSESLFRALPTTTDNQIHPCDHCMDKPCLTACPVGAFTGTTLEVGLCRDHLASGNNPDCMSIGCRARATCPVGNEYTYGEAQLRFHMQSFKSA